MRKQYMAHSGTESNGRFRRKILCRNAAGQSNHTEQEKEPVSEIEKKYQELLETLSPEQEEVITEYCNAIFSSGADTEEFFYRLGLKDGLNLKNTVKSVLEILS